MSLKVYAVVDRTAERICVTHKQRRPQWKSRPVQGEMLASRVTLFWGNRF